MQVFVVYVEYQANEPYVVGVFTSEAAANAAAAAEARRQMAENHETVFARDAVTGEVDHEQDMVDWTIDVHVAPCELQEGA